MALKVGDILKRLGLRGAIIRYGEPWKTQETKDLEDDIRAFYQKYEPYLKREEEYPFEFNTDLNDVLQKHGPRLWPDGPRSEDATRWLFPAGEIAEYPEDVYFTRHFDKIQPLFATLLSMRVKVYRSNQRHAELKAKEKREAEAAAAANASTLDHPLPDSDLTDFDSHDEMPSLVHAIKFTRDDTKAKLQEIVKNDEFNLRKRKHTTDSPSKSIKRPRKSTVPVEPVEQDHNQNVSAWTTTNPEITHVASFSGPGNEHELLVAAASGHSHGFVAVNQTAQSVQPAQIVQQVQEISDSDEDPSAPQRTAPNQQSSDGSSPNNETHQLPDTPGEDVRLPTQYSLPQDAAKSSEMTPEAAQRLKDYQQALAEVSAEIASEPQVSDKFIPWPKISKRRAKRSKTSLRPMLDNDGMELSAQDGQSPTQLPSRPSFDIPNLPPQQEGAQQEGPNASPDDIDNTDSRKLKRRTHVRTPAAEPSKRATSTIPTTTPISTQKRSYQTPYADAHPPLPTPQSVSSSADAVLGAPNPQLASVDAVLGAVNPQLAPMDSPLVASSGPTVINKQMPPPANMPLSALLITNHFAHTFVKFTLPVSNGLPENKMIKLADCFDAVALHQAVINRFKHALAGRIPSEIVFTFANQNYVVDADESGQYTWDDFMQTVVDNAPAGTCPIVASIRV
ncbi:hypothetical protein E4T50_04049 [Aureobasidium sp. EXF-12298]|nr:hypothetical protein E4T50_04049 [Aureobasidium sp. EXF-12298]